MGGVTGRAGPTWERIVADYARDVWDLPWERAPLRGNRDLLDLQGTLPAGFLVGCKALTRKGSASFGAKISEAADQLDRALINLGHQAGRDGNGRIHVASNGIIPVQIMQRSGYPVGKSYVLTETDYFLDLAVRRSKWRGEE